MSTLPRERTHRTTPCLPAHGQLPQPQALSRTFAYQVAHALPLAEFELSLVQMKSEAIRRGSSSSTALAGRDNRSQALGKNQSLLSHVAVPRALRQIAAQQQVPEEMKLPSLAFSLPAALETSASRAAAGAAAGQRDSGLGALIILLAVVVVLSALVYLAVAQSAKPSAGEREKRPAGRGSERLPTAGGSEGLPSKSRPFASPETSRLFLEDPCDLPMIYPDLVMAGARTRLAIPVEPLSEQEFEIDVLGLSGVPLLTATLNARSGRRTVQVCLHSVGTLLAKVTSSLQLLGPDGAHFGTLSKDGSAQQVPNYVLRAPGGRVILTIIPGQDPHEMQLVAQRAGRSAECARVLRRSAGRLPAEHFEVAAAPGVDAVLVLACFLGLEAFETPGGGRASGLFA